METVIAYIDPGSGSLIIQGVIAALVAIPVFFRTRISRVARTIRRTDTRRSNSSAPTDDSAPGA